MAQKNLSIKLSLNDKQFQSNLKKATRSINKFGNQMKRTGQTLSKSLTAPILAFGAISVKAFDDQVKAEAKLRTSLKGNEDAFKRLKAQAQELQKVTLFGDEATIEAQAFLAQLGLTESAILKLTPLVQDFAAAQGIQLTDAAKLVAKSVGSSTNALSRYGITIEGEVGSTERLESAVNALTTAFGGTSEAISKVGLGPLEQLKNQLGDVSEQFGSIVLEGIEPLKTGLQKLADLLSNLTKEQKENIVKFAALAAAIGPIVIILGSLITSIGAIIPLVVKLVAVFNPMVALGVAVAGSLTFVAKKLGLFRKEIKKTNEESKKVDPNSILGGMMSGDTKNPVTGKAFTTPKKQETSAPSFKKSPLTQAVEPIKALNVELKDVSKNTMKAVGGVQTMTETFTPLQGVINSLNQSLINIATQLGNTFLQGAQSIQEFGTAVKMAAREAIGAFIAEGVAASIASSLKNPAFAINPALIPVVAGLAGGLAKTAFNELIPEFAEGGIVSGPTMGVIGEYPGASANPEVIAPLDKLKNMIGGAGGSVQVFGSISGSDILLSSDRAKNNRNRTRGY